MARRFMVFGIAAALSAYVGCKQESAPKPPDKKADTTPVNASSPPTNPPPLSPPPAEEPEEESGGEGESGTGCTSSSCKEAGALEILADGTVVTTLTLSEQKSTANLAVKSTRYDERTFKLRAKPDNASVNVTTNDAESVTVTRGGNGATNGTITITARDVMSCEKDGSSSCDDMDESVSSDEQLTLPWSADGTVGSIGGGGGGNDVALQVGLQILAKILGLDGGGGLLVGGQGQGPGEGQQQTVGGGFANGWGGGQGALGGGQAAAGQGVGATPTPSLSPSVSPSPGVSPSLGAGGSACKAEACGSCTTKAECDRVQCIWDLSLKSCR